MGRLIKAEFLKVFTTKLWWALLIPAAVLSLAFTWGGAAIGVLGEVQDNAGGALPLSLPFFAQGINFATVFAMILGGTAVTSEIRHKTITTSYLTGPSRGSVLAAKLAVFSAIGAIYGLACMLSATLGAVFGGNFPDTADWFLLAGTGVVAMIMWTLLGVGLGALIGNQVGTTVGLLIYVLVAEPIIAGVLRGNDAPGVPGYLPSTAGGNMVTNLSIDLFVEGLPGDPARNQENYEKIREFFNLDSAPIWWASGLIFIGYALVVGLVGWLVAKNRDIT